LLLTADFTSIIGCITVLVGFWRLRLMRNHITRVIAYFCVTSAIKDIVAVTLTLSKAYLNSKFACYLYAVDITFGSFSCWMWTLCLAISIYIVIVQIHVVPDRFEKYYMIVSWGLPLISCIIMVSTPNLVSNVGSWCWIGAKYPGYRFGLFYIPFFVIFAAAAIMVGLTSHYTYKVLTSGISKTVESKHGAYQFKLINYIIVFLICWVFAVVNRILNAFNLYPYATNLLHTYLSVSHGFYASLVFIYNNPMMWRYFGAKLLFPLTLLGLFQETYRTLEKNKYNNNSSLQGATPKYMSQKTCQTSGGSLDHSHQSQGLSQGQSGFESGIRLDTEEMSLEMSQISIVSHGNSSTDNLGSNSSANDLSDQ
ncbi:hypothetical protein SAMD00019534_093520, partial [Acytostelium subglobosum LB1]